ncbi:MAG: SPASM domain-containing protein [Bacteroidales bacterium]|nr:SPASM domain-containing protein [Bacteroidales bacterium]
MLLNTAIKVNGYVESKYNILCSTKDNGIMLYNSLYKQLIELNADEFGMISGGVIDSTSDLGKVLVDMRFVISPTFNELEYYKYHYNRSHFDNSTIALSILTTLACNMSCPYCYESKTNTFMKHETADQIIDWVGANLSDKKVLSINWFGGEPLLKLDIIEYLSKGFMSLCEKHNVRYTASITTNGYLLDTQAVQTLESCNVFDVQVTFDGNKQLHNTIKHLANGQGSYDRIVSNISNYCCISKSHLPLRIRVNLSDDNYDSISLLLNDLPEVVKEHSSIFFRWLYANEASGWNEFSKKKQSASVYKGIFDLLKIAHDKGYHIENRCESEDFCFCEADNPGFYTIDPLGNIYLCVHDYKPEFSIGNVFKGITPEKQTQFYAFRNVSVLNDDECMNCKVLPICNGGCRKFRFEGKKQCIFEKDNLDLYVENIYHKYSNV